MRFLTTLLVLVFSASAALAEPADEVRCREIGFSRSAENQDHAAFRRFLDADARFVSNSVLRGPEAIATAWLVFFQENGPTIRWRPQIIEVLDDGKLALSRGPYRVITTDENGERVEQWGTYNSVWRLNDDGAWRIVFDAGSPAAAAPDEATRALLEADDDCL